MAGKKVYGKVPKRAGIYCLRYKVKSPVRCVRRSAPKGGKPGKTYFLKSKNIKCGCGKRTSKRTGR